MCSTIAFQPSVNDSKVGSVTVKDGETVDLTGANTFDPGKSGVAGSQDLRDFNVVSGSQYLDASILTKGSQNGTASYTDPITGSVRTVNVYVNGQMGTSLLGDQKQTVYQGVGSDQYIDARVGSVDSSGGTLNIKSTGNITIAAKQTTLYTADGTGTADAKLSWQTPGNTTIVMNGATLPSNVLPGQNTVTSSALAGWPTTVTVNGTAYTINNLADYQAFNTTLVGLIETGSIDQAQYDSYITQAANLQSGSVRYDVMSPLPADTDDVWQAVGTRSVLAANGAHASAEIQAGSTLTVTGANGGVLRGTNGATVSNAGTIVSNDGTSLYLSGGSTGTNTGVITAKGTATGVNTTGSTFTNENIINKGVGSNTSAITANNSTVTNNGIINLGTAASSSNTSAYGVDITGGSFTNSADAVIYIGRGEQTDPASPAADVALNLGGNLAAINVRNGATVNNEGAIVIGTKTQGASGIRVDGASNVQVDNSGSITVKGAATDAPRLNTGIYVRNAGADGASSITNSGSILVEGVNGIGMQVIADGAGKAANATSTGSITVAGGADPTSNTRNFGVWVEGANGGSATTDLSGPVTLTGVGAIGVHARGTAEVTVEDSATVEFASGTDQIGYYIYGPDAKISVLRNALEVKTERSTLFRIADGASFDGQGYTMTASGKDSLGVLGTGAGTKIETKGSTFYLTGEGATAVTVEGGATGTIDSATKIYLNAAGTIAGIADGQKHDLSGNPVGDPDAATKLVNAAALSSSQTGVTGLIARNKASVENSGEVAFSGSGSTGLLAETAGKLTNTAKVTVGGPDSFGLVAQTGGEVTNSGAVFVKGADSYGLLAQNQGKVTNKADGVVTVSGANGIGLAAHSNSLLENHAAVYANADGVTGIEVSGKSVAGNDGDIQLNGSGSTGIRADDGTVANTGDVTSAGTGNIGLAALGGGSIATTGNVSLTGAGSIGLYGASGGRIEATGSEIDVAGWALAAGNGASTFVLKGVAAKGTDGLLSATDGANTSIAATGSDLFGRAFTAAGSTSSLNLVGSAWTIPANSNVTDLVNDGSVIAFTPPSGGGFKTLTVENDYTGANGAQINLYTTLNNAAVQLTDKLVVHGDTAGSTLLSITNANGFGAATIGDGIEVVQVDGSSAGTFALAHDVYAGAWEYDLFKGGLSNPNDGDWYLRSSLSAGAQTIVPYADSLLRFGQQAIGTLQQRTGNRLWPQDSQPAALYTKAPQQETAKGSEVVGGGVWGRVLGLTGSINATSGVGYDQDLWFAQAGVDGVLYETRDGTLVAGIIGTYGTQNLDVAVSASPATGLARQGHISTDAYGIGGSLTWLGVDGLYVDGVGQYTWYDSTLSATGFPALAKGNGGEGYALSLEVGKRLALSGGWNWVPQAQLVYSSVSIDDFTYFNPNGTWVAATNGGGDSLLGRLGVRLEDVSRTSTGQRFQAYGIVNLTYEFLNGTDVAIGASGFTQQSKQLWGEAGLGGTYAFTDRVSVYGEGLYSTALGDFGDSYNLRGILGVRVNW